MMDEKVLVMLIPLNIMLKQRCLGQELSQFNMFHKIRKAWCHVGVLLLSSRIPLLEGDENVTNFMFHGFRSSKPC